MSIVPRHQLLIVFSIVLLIQYDIDAQIISGIVLNYQTKESVPFSNIYFNNSYNGTVSDIDGNFELNISQNPGQDIIVSCVGYKTQLIEDYIPGEYYKVYLIPHTYLLEPLVLVANSRSRMKMMKMFLKEFLGETKNARKCAIENLDDLRLEYDSSSSTLVAVCSKPLVISNKALGYKIRYFLEEFKLDKNGMKYLGYSMFEEDTTFSKQEIIQIKKRREKAYLGSRMHFFRTLWNGELPKSKFTVFDYRKSEKIHFQDHIQTENQDVKMFYSPNTLKIIYSINGVSLISFDGTGEIHFTKNGYFNPKGLHWRGHMSRRRIADLLPYEYSPTIENNNELAFQMPKDDLKEKIISTLNEVNQVHIIEKVHLHLDKYLYTLGEQIWLKAYVLEGASHQLLPQSKVLYVELINSQNELVRRFKLPTNIWYC